MQVGLYIDGRNPEPWARPWSTHYGRTIELAVEGERLGLDAMWLAEHHFFDDGYVPQPLTLAAAIAARTTRVRVGIAVLLAPFRHALHIAEEAAVVDLISGGRLELGLGAGYRPLEFDAFDAPMSQRFASTERTIARVQELLEDVRPRPLQQPVPLWGGFYGPRGARIAGRHGMGLLALDRALLEPYVAGLVEGGRTAAAARMGSQVDIIVADDPDAAWPRLAPHFAYHRDSYAIHRVRGTDIPEPPPIAPEELRWTELHRKGRGFAVLTPEQAVTWVAALARDLPVEHVYFWASVGGMPDDLVERHVELVASVVAPALRGSSENGCP